MTDSRRFAFVLPKDLKNPHGDKTSGIYSTMPFSVGGKRRPPFPLGIECDTAETAQACLDLLQPIADRYGAASPREIVQALSDFRPWGDVCRLMDALTDTFWTVTLGKRVGIYITRSGAERSLEEADSERWRQVDRFSAFDGAFKCMVTGGNTLDKKSYIGEELGRIGRGATEPAKRGTPEKAPSSQASYVTRTPQTPRQGGAYGNVGGSGGGGAGLFTGYSSQLFNLQLLGATLPNGDDSPSPTVRRSLKKATRVEEPAPAVEGYWYRLYLETHDYTDDAADTLRKAYEESHSQESFVSILETQGLGLTKGEAKFVYALMVQRPPGRAPANVW
ncbi:hypothetical protein FPV67DRAFT_1477150 [Lyophyllum atratum]|nr:hypothetical protein FPV67DRAFT_1477150 [Lyophyllum atratum]